MKVKAHRAFAKIHRMLAEQRELLTAWSGAAYRVTTLDYPSPKSILSGEGSFMHGGRWNAPGSFRAVYGSTADVVAVAESRATADYAGFPYPFRTPRLLVTLELNLQRVLDLTAKESAGVFAEFSEELGREDWRKMNDLGVETISQCLGRAVFEAGASGLLAPSAKVAGGVNVIYMPENRGAADEAKVCEPEKLDRIRGQEDK
jgi:RES domain-containing protein